MATTFGIKCLKKNESYLQKLFQIICYKNSINLNDGNRYDKIGSFDISRVTTPEYSFPKIDIPSVEAISIDPENTIMGDIKRQIQAQNELASQQINILLEQNKLLSDNYMKLKEMYDAQSGSYADAKEDLRQHRINATIRIIQ